MTRRTTIAAVVAILVIGASAVLAFDAGSRAEGDALAEQETTTGDVPTTPDSTATPGATATAAGTTTAARDPNVTFANQTSTGTAVVVDSVVVPEGGFVAVFRSAKAVEEETTAASTETQRETLVPGGVATQEYVADELAGNSTYLEPGVHRNVTVQLDRALEESQILVAMPYEDANDNQRFDFPQADEPYLQFAPVNDWALVTLESEGNQSTAGTETATEGA